MTNLYRKILGLLVFSIVVSCNYFEKDGTALIFKDNYTLKHKFHDTELLISSGRITVIDSFLILVSLQQDPFCKVYSIPNNMKEVYGYGHIGNGPGEFLQPLLTYSYSNTFGLNEVNKQELAIMQITSTNDNISIVEKSRLKAPYERKMGELNPPDYYFTKLDDTHYVSWLGAGENLLFSLLDSALVHINRFGESPIPEELSIINFRTRLNGPIAANDGTMVFATSKLPYLACYKLKNDILQKQWSIFYDQAHYTIRNDDLLLDKEKSFGRVLDLKMDSQYIYVLYLDMLHSEFDFSEMEKSLANKVLVFNHQGDAVAKLHLSCHISNMSLSSSQAKLFGLAQLPEPTIVEFDLPKKLTRDRN